MGLFKKMRDAMGEMKEVMGGDDAALMEGGQLGRAVVQNLAVKGMSVQVGAMPPEQVCEFDLLVYLDDTPPFVAKTRKRIPQYAIAQFVPGQTVVAVRVDPQDHSRVGMDLTVEPPEVRMAASAAQRSAADILANGTPCEAVIVEYEPLGMKNPNNVDLYALKLTVFAEGAAPYQITVGNPVPPEAVALLFPGSKLPAKFDPYGVREDVAVDWAAAVGP